MPVVDEKKEHTGLGNYFVANYPPFSFWKPELADRAREILAGPPRPDTPLGLYLHIPFCRKRCKFCYFRVYTDKNARDVEVYLDALVEELELYSRQPIIGGRSLQFVYFGGGTPSYLSASQLRKLSEGLKRHFAWTEASEITFECEPGTLQQHKLQALKDIGVTRLSLGIENFDDAILHENGRAHLSAEIYRAYEWVQRLAFDQVNIDLIAGMVGESWPNWRECIRKTIELAPDSVTIYQMELPYNTEFSKEFRIVGREDATGPAVADWPTKREWVSFAFDELSQAGYQPSSAYTMVKKGNGGRFVYRDSLWHGADMIGTGVASFGHLNGVHLQNVDLWEDYVGRLKQSVLPIGRALPVTPHQLCIREMILQLKTGRLDRGYFRSKFHTDVGEAFAEVFERYHTDGWLTVEPDRIELSRDGLMQVDRLLPAFFEPAHRVSRYT